MLKLGRRSPRKRPAAMVPCGVSTASFSWRDACLATMKPSGPVHDRIDKENMKVEGRFGEGPPAGIVPAKVVKEKLAAEGE